MKRAQAARAHELVSPQEAQGRAAAIMAKANDRMIGS
jgi:hypothetical protein